MITIYHRDGSSKETDSPLLEIASSDGRPALFIVTDDEGKIEILAEPNPRFRGLCKTLGKEPADIVTNLPDF